MSDDSEQVDSKPEEQGSLRSAMIIGSAWMIGMRWSIRGIGVVSIIILARLLDPDDFGLIAMSSVFIGFLNVMTSFGVDMALIQRQDATQGHYDTAWTIRLLQAIFVTAVVILCSSLAADYFNEPRVKVLLMVSSISIVISGLENIGVVAFRKDLEFHKEFQFKVIPKIIGFFVTIGFVFVFRSYWGLVLGNIFRSCIRVGLSYRVHPYRPRFSLSEFRDLWSFSQWMLFRNFGMFLRRQVDVFMVGRFFPAADLGVYRVSQEISEMPTTELVWPMSRALFPGYAKLSHNPKDLGRAYIKVLNTLSLIMIPAGVGLALVSEPLTLLALGTKWASAAPVIFWLSLYGVCLTLSASVQAPLMALGLMRRVTLLVWCQLFVVLPVVYLAVQQGELVLVAQAQLGASLFLLPMFFFAMTTNGLVTWRAVVSALWRPVVASAVMFACVTALDSLAIQVLFAKLVAQVLVGAVSFVLTGFLLWHLSGRPDGGEQLVMSIIGRKLKR